ncbi:hypothetical protein BDN71DRAFT_467316 [Pleurotus eryngii]|uniref:F-box domain-containing protein n=1 Tax=Pleurotus eryngii TaxID=5323 RepID=A0A9P5ZM63_PLEER|nr:hypothetical protein BDN71DRAFT_467316 [Pleurotus eryngii]
MPTPQLTLPPEIWIRISSFLSPTEVTRLYGVNRLFYELAMDCRYSHLLLYDYRTFKRTEACLSASLSQKYVKSLYIYNLFTLPGAIPTASMAENGSEQSSSFSRRFLLAGSAIRRWIRRSTGCMISTTPHPAMLVRSCIADSLSRAGRLQEVTIGGEWSSEYEKYILRPLYSALSNHSSIRKLRVESDKLWVVLPFMEFRGLEEVTVVILCHTLPEVKPSMGALSGFLRHVAPSIRALTLSAVWNSCPAIDDVSPVVCADGEPQHRP